MTASLLIAQMKHVLMALSKGFFIAGKSHVVAICRTLAASSVGVSPGFLFNAAPKLVPL